MIVMIDVPESLVEEAKALGVSVETLVREKIENSSASNSISPLSLSLGPTMQTPMTPAEAGAGLRALQKRYTLGGTVTIKQLIEEGRRY